MADIVYPFLLYFFIGTALVLLISRVIPVEERKRLVLLLMVGLCLRLAAATAFATLPSTRMFHDDADGYEKAAVWLSEDWKGRAQPYPVPEANYGYIYLSAAQCFVFGGYPIIPSLGNCLFGILAAFYVFLIGRRFFNFQVAILATRLIVFFPSMIIWSSVAMKDVVMHFLILCVLYHVISFHSRFRWRDVVVIGISTVAIFTIRFYIMYVLLVSVLASFVLSGRFLSGMRLASQGVMIALVAVAVVAFGMDTEARSGAERLTYKQLSVTRRGLATTARSGFRKEAEVSSPAKALALMPVGLLYLLFSPLPWQYTSLRSALTLPEMLVWWAMTPFWIAGLAYLARNHFRQFGVIIVFSALMLSAYSVFHGNIGVMFRQRTQVLVFLFIFLAFGYYRWKYRRLGWDTAPLFQGLAHAAG